MLAKTTRAGQAVALAVALCGCSFEPASDLGRGALAGFQPSLPGPDAGAALSFQQADKLFIARDEFAYGRPSGRPARRAFGRPHHDPLLTSAEREPAWARRGAHAAERFDRAD